MPEGWGFCTISVFCTIREYDAEIRARAIQRSSCHALSESLRRPRGQLRKRKKMVTEAAPSSAEITVLVCLRERRRPVRLSPSSLEALKVVVLSQFSDVHKCDLLLQIKDDNWDGMFVDIVEGHSILDRSVVEVVVDMHSITDINKE